MEKEVLFAYPLALQTVLFIIFAISSVLIVTAILSAKSMGGRLGMGLKKIAGGSILHAALFLLMVLLDQGWSINIRPEHLRIFVIGVIFFGSALLISGFLQIYKISRELKLFY